MSDQQKPVPDSQLSESDRKRLILENFTRLIATDSIGNISFIALSACPEHEQLAARCGLTLSVEQVPPALINYWHKDSNAINRFAELDDLNQLQADFNTLLDMSLVLNDVMQDRIDHATYEGSLALMQNFRELVNRLWRLWHKKCV